MLEMKPTTAALTATRRPSNAGDDGEYDVEALAVDASYDGKLAPVTQLHELATGYEPQLATKDAELAQRERRIRELEIQLAKTMQQPPPTNAAEIGANEKKRHLAAIARTQCARSQSELRACVCVNGGRCGDGSPACLRREVVHAVGAARWARRPPLVLLLLRSSTKSLSYALGLPPACAASIVSSCKIAS